MITPKSTTTFKEVWVKIRAQTTPIMESGTVNIIINGWMIDSN